LTNAGLSPSDINFDGPATGRANNLDFYRLMEISEETVAELRGEIDFLRKHVPAAVLHTARATRDWNELVDLAADKLGLPWRKLIQKKLGITKRRLELRETPRAVIPEGAFAELRRMPNHVEPDGPQPATNATSPPPVNDGANSIWLKSAGSNSLSDDRG
jgi:nitrogenase molybdenum-iron protein alpha/beta subunit